MLKDSFVEQIVDAKTPYVFFARLGTSVALIFFGVLMLVNNPLVGLGFVLIGMIFFNLVKDERRIEYEYSLSNLHVEIAIIYNKTKRRDLRGFDLGLVSVIAPGTSKRFDGMGKMKVYDYSSGYDDAETVLFYYEDNNNKKYLFKLEPNEEVLEHIKQFAKDKMTEF